MRNSQTKAGSASLAPDNTLVYAVGDIHGQLHLLDALLTKIVADAAQAPEFDRRVLVFVGDYVDRGPDSAGVIGRLISGLPDGFDAHCLMGNHEAALLDFLDDPSLLPHWLSNGAGATLASYGVEAPDENAALPAFIQCRDAFYAALPSSHLGFLRGLSLSVTMGDYHFVHAGIRPGVPLDEQVRRDSLWIRNGFLDSDADFGCVVVHGHTPGPEPVEKKNRVCIDTGAWAYRRLTALRLAGSRRAFMHVDEDETG